MRLLLIAYEYPPSPSPQSLRWIYLSRELAALGHEVHVMTPDLGGETPGLPALPAEVRVHRSFPGLARGMLAVLRKRAQRKALLAATAAATGSGTRSAAPARTAPAPLRPPRHWKQRVSETIQRIAEHVHFPDIRGEWRHWARRDLRRLLDTAAPDVVISSHEPATTLELGLFARQRGLPWVADLGDPVLAGYTPPRWRRRAHRLERAVCREADLVTVTNAGAAALLLERHARAGAIAVLPQGYDDRSRDSPASADLFDPARLELLYTGSFYSFRRIDALLEALGDHPQIRLSIAAVTVPEAILAAAKQAPERIRLLGFLPHTTTLALQRQADVLINIANDDLTQIPGKFYEYLGAGRPILHLGNGTDPVAAMVVELQRGWACTNARGGIGDRLEALAAAKAAGSLEAGLALGTAGVEQYGWSRIAARLDALLRDVVAGRRRG